MSADALLAYYGKQAEEQGWTREPRAAAAGAWTHADSSGRGAQTLLLRVEPVAGVPECYHVEMLVRTAPPR